MRPYELAIAVRYMRSENRNRFVSFISVTSILGIAVAVAVLIVVLSVMNGFEIEVRERILNVIPHAEITGLDGRIDDWPRLVETARADPAVRDASPFINGQAMLVGAGGIRGIQLRGIDPANPVAARALGALMTAGRIDQLGDGEYRIVLGETAAGLLGVTVGDRVVAMVAEGVTTPAGVVPRMRRFVVSGTFNAGMYEFDKGLAFIHLADARRLLRFGAAASGVQLEFHDALQAPVRVRQVAADFGGGVYVGDWTRQHANFFRSIQLTRSIVFVILLLVVAVAAFNIVSTLVMVVRDKQAEIAILRTIGAAPGGILRIFVLQGTLVGLIGTLAGVLLGVLAAWNISAITAVVEGVFGLRFISPDVYFISELPSRLLWGDVGQIAAIALSLALLSTIYPAWRAALMAPAEVLRHE